MGHSCKTQQEDQPTTSGSTRTKDHPDPKVPAALPTDEPRGCRTHQVNSLCCSHGPRGQCDDQPPEGWHQNPQDMLIHIKEIRHGCGGRIILDLDKQEDLTKILPHLNQAGVTATPLQNRSPRMTFHDIPSDWTAQQLQDVFTAANVINTTPEQRKSALPLHKVGQKCQKWVVQVLPSLRKAIQAHGRVLLGWYSCKINDSLSITRCYKCQLYRLIAQHCTSTETCSHCSQTGHRFLNCPKKNQPPKCAACKGTKNPTPTAHQTTLVPATIRPS